MSDELALVASKRASIVACILCSAGAGLGAGFFGCILSWANHVKIRNDGKHTTCSKRVATLGVIGSTIFGLGSLAGLFFGPVTLVVVIRAGTLLPANAIFSQLFGFRPLTRDDLLGTLVTVSGVVCFSLFGGTPPPAPKEAEFMEMFCSLGSVVTNIVLVSIFVLGLLMVVVDRGMQGGRPEENAGIALGIGVATVSGCSSAFMDVAAKGWSAVLDTGGVDYALASLTFWIALLINIVFLVAMRLSMIYGCKRCDVLLFVPLSTVSNILFSVLAGMAVLKEYKQVNSWPGLLAASVSVLGGVVMLVSGPATKDEDVSPPSGNHWYADSDESDEEEEASLRGGRLRVASSTHGEEVIRSASEQQRLGGAAEAPSSDEESEDDDVCLPPLVDERRETSTWLPGGWCFFCSCVKTKGQELVHMNHSHWEAARIRRRWGRVRENLRDMVGEAAQTHFGHVRSTRTAAAVSTERSYPAMQSTGTSGRTVATMSSEELEGR